MSTPKNTLIESPELTLRAILLCITLAVVMGASNIYLGLRLGMTVSASIPAAVVAMMVFRFLKKSSSPILESNLVQTAASAGESMAAGVLFTTPALLMMGVRQEFNYLEITALSMCSGFLGVLFMVPMRQVFITTTNPELKFPEALACAAVLKAGNQTSTDSNEQVDGGGIKIVLGMLYGAGYKLMSSLLGILNSSIGKVFGIGSKYFFFSFETSLALVGVGYIVGLNVALLIAGSSTLTWLSIPLWIQTPMHIENATDLIFSFWASTVRYVGVGIMIVGGIECIYKVRNSLVEAVSAVLTPQPTSSSSPQDLSTKAILAVLIPALSFLWVYFLQVTQQGGLSSWMLALTFLLAFFFTAAFCYIAGVIGMSNSPLSGIMISCILVTGGVLTLLGYSGELAMTATLLVVTASGCSLVIAGDACNDLKTGHLLGASPRLQQLAQLIGVVASSLIMAPVLNLLHQYTPGGIGGPELAAPQANLIASLISGIFGQSDLPVNIVLLGAGIAGVLLILDQWLQKRDYNFRLLLMPIGLGVYLPLDITVPLLFGACISYKLTRGKPEHEQEAATHQGTMFASGLIAGESLTGVLIAGLAAFSIHRMDWLQDTTLAMVVSMLLYLFAIVSYIKASQK
ncbi:MAG: oligopeptide transporter, OPT family [Zetaproteobacteria bacterium]|nr:oligopeptide transporter, OPT family [Zetaproteobacteria bacterium]